MSVFLYLYLFLHFVLMILMVKKKMMLILCEKCYLPLQQQSTPLETIKVAATALTFDYSSLTGNFFTFAAPHATRQAVIGQIQITHSTCLISTCHL